VPREIVPLVDAFNAAVRRIGESYDAQDRFLVGAAHELRMPIAILATRIADLPPGQVRSRLQRDLGRLSNIAEQLLDLQRLDHHRSQHQRIDLAALTGEVAADVAPLLIDAGYEFAVEAPDAPVWACCRTPSPMAADVDWWWWSCRPAGCCRSATRAMACPSRPGNRYSSLSTGYAPAAVAAGWGCIWRVKSCCGTAAASWPKRRPVGARDL
jgi:hypothetical protein